MYPFLVVTSFLGFFHLRGNGLLDFQHFIGREKEQVAAEVGHAQAAVGLAFHRAGYLRAVVQADDAWRGGGILCPQGGRNQQAADR